MTQVIIVPPGARLIALSELVAAYESGLTAREVGEKFGITLDLVYWSLRKIGYKLRGRGSPGKPNVRAKTTRNAEIIARVQAGETLSDIASKLGVSYQRVQQISSRAGIRAKGRPTKKTLEKRRIASQRRAELAQAIADRNTVREGRYKKLAADAKQMRDQGMRWEEIAASVERSTMLVLRVAQKYYQELRVRAYKARGRLGAVTQASAPEA